MLEVYDNRNSAKKKSRRFHYLIATDFEIKKHLCPVRRNPRGYQSGQIVGQLDAVRHQRPKATVLIYLDPTLFTISPQGHSRHARDSEGKLSRTTQIKSGCL